MWHRGRSPEPRWRTFLIRTNTSRSVLSRMTVWFRSRTSPTMSQVCTSGKKTVSGGHAQRRDHTWHNTLVAREKNAANHSQNWDRFNFMNGSHVFFPWQPVYYARCDSTLIWTQTNQNHWLFIPSWVTKQLCARYLLRLRNFLRLTRKCEWHCKLQPLPGFGRPDRFHIKRGGPRPEALPTTPGRHVGFSMSFFNNSLVTWNLGGRLKPGGRLRPFTTGLDV